MHPVRETLAPTDAKAKERLTRAWKAGKLKQVKADYWSSGYFGRGHLGCVAPTHVRWATREENERDKIAHGSIRTGERHPMAKLSAEDVCQIRKDDRPQWQIATSYNVTQTTISDIKTGRKWARGL